MIKKELINEIFEITQKSGDFTELFLETNKSLTLSMTARKLDKIINGKDKGIGIRIFNKFDSVYGFTNDLSKENLLKLASDLSMSLKNGTNTYKEPKKTEVKENHVIKVMPDTVSIADKKDIMLKASNAAYGYSDLISQVVVNYKDYVQDIEVINTDGLHKKDTRVRIRLFVTAVASRDGEMQSGYSGDIGGARGFEIFNDFDYISDAKKSAKLAVDLLDAKTCPSSEMPVILENKFGGVIFHEACGHGLEATFVAKNTSVFANKLGTKVASDCVTAIDDPTIKNAWGSNNIDDEGNETKKNILIENGILKNYMIDRLGARRMDTDVTTSSRRESYKYPATSRMSNTFIANGTSSLEDMLKGIKFGLYAKSLGGGSVTPSTGDFNFSVREAYLIEDGKITDLVKGASLIGNGPEALHKIEMIGDNLDYSRGMCGSVSGAIPADVGQPRIKISSILVGGGK